MQETLLDDAIAPVLELEPKAPTLPAAPAGPAVHQVAEAQAVDPYRLLQAAVERNMPLEVIEKLLSLAERVEQMRERERQRRAESAYTAALAALKAEVVTVIKRKAVDYPGKNGRVSYKHAELSDIMEAVAESANRHGLTWNYPEFDQGEDPIRTRWITVTCRLKHVDGHSESIFLGGPPDDSGGKNAMQAIHSGITYLERITLKALLGIAEKGDDNDGRGAGDSTDGGAGKPPRPDPRPDLDAYPSDRFELNLPQWREAVRDGKTTPDKLIAMLSTKGTLNATQTAKLRALAQRSH